MKTLLQTIKQLNKLNVTEMRVVINVYVNQTNLKDQEIEFENILNNLDELLKDEPFKWSRIENHAGINKNINIVFTLVTK